MATGRGKPFSQRTKGSQRRIRSAFERVHALRPGYTWQQAQRDLREGHWTPFARNPVQRVPERYQGLVTPEHVERISTYRRRYRPQYRTVRVSPGQGPPDVIQTQQGGLAYKVSLDDQGRIDLSPAVLRSVNSDTRSDLANWKAENFKGYIYYMAETGISEYVKAKFAFDEVEFADRRSRWSEDTQIAFLTMSYEEWRTYVSTETLSRKEAKQAPPEELWYHSAA